MLLVEQNARAALETADYGYVLESGEVVHQGRASDLIRDPQSDGDLSRQERRLIQTVFKNKNRSVTWTFPLPRNRSFCAIASAS